MKGFFVRMLITAGGLWVAALLVPGVNVQGLGPLLMAALGMGLVNALLRPVIVLVTLPLTVVTFGLFLLVVNAALFGLVAALLPGFSVTGFFPALFGWLVVSLVGGLTSWFIGPQGQYEVLIIERHRRPPS